MIKKNGFGTAVSHKTQRCQHDVFLINICKLYNIDRIISLLLRVIIYKDYCLYILKAKCMILFPSKTKFVFVK